MLNCRSMLRLKIHQPLCQAKCFNSLAPFPRNGPVILGISAPYNTKDADRYRIQSPGGGYTSLRLKARLGKDTDSRKMRAQMLPSLKRLSAEERKKQREKDGGLVFTLSSKDKIQYQGVKIASTCLSLVTIFTMPDAFKMYVITGSMVHMLGNMIGISVILAPIFFHLWGRNFTQKLYYNADNKTYTAYFLKATPFIKQRSFTFKKQDVQYIPHEDTSYWKINNFVSKDKLTYFYIPPNLKDFVNQNHFPEVFSEAYEKEKSNQGGKNKQK